MAKQTVSGQVESTNDRGLKFDGEWLNYSKFFKGDKPERGDDVEMVVDGKWINGVKILAGRSPAPSRNGTGRGAPVRSDETNLRIARQVALKAAVDGLGADAGDDTLVVGLARKFEAYLNEPFGAPAAQDDEDDVEF
jgi:hypothetical protein